MKTADEQYANCGKNCKINLKICQGGSCCSISKITGLYRNMIDNFQECKNTSINLVLPMEIFMQNEGKDQWIGEFVNVTTSVNGAHYYCSVNKVKFGNSIKKICKLEEGIHFEIDWIFHSSSAKYKFMF